MNISIQSFLVSSALALSLFISACSKPTDNSELDEIKQELSELKKEMARADDAKVEEAPEVQKPSADDVAFDEAKSDGRVRAFGKYAKEFKEGRHLSAADEGAWASAKRQNSVAAYDAYRFHFPDGKNVNQSHRETVRVQSEASDKALTELGYNSSDFPSFGALSMDSDGNVENEAQNLEVVSAVNVTPPQKNNSYGSGTAPTKQNSSYGSGIAPATNEVALRLNEKRIYSSDPNEKKAARNCEKFRNELESCFKVEASNEHFKVHNNCNFEIRGFVQSLGLIDTILLEQKFIVPANTKFDLKNQKDLSDWASAYRSILVCPYNHQPYEDWEKIYNVQD